jgi:hypothetical protein
MQGFFKLLILFISIKVPLSAMHFVRVARKSPRRSVPTRYYTIDQKKHDGHKKDTSTTITYKGQQFTPVEFAGHIALQVAATSMNLFKEIAHVEDIECPCIKPYLMLPAGDFYSENRFRIIEAKPKLKEARHKYAIAELQLEYAIGQYKDSSAEVVKLQAIKQNLCSNLDRCCKQFANEMTKKRIRNGTNGVLLSFFPTVALLAIGEPGLAGVSLCFFSIGGLIPTCAFTVDACMPEKLGRKAAALGKYIEYKTTEINGALEEVVTKAPLKSVASPEIKYLSAPQKTDSH